MTTTLSGRYEFIEQETKPQIGIGSQLKLFDNKLTLRALFANKYRRPSIDDKYWPIWGNLDLVPEYGFTIENGIEYSILKINKVDLNNELSVFYLLMNDMITWLPADDGDWHPYNFSQGVNKGLEYKLNFNYNFNSKNSFKNTFIINYTDSKITKSKDNDILQAGNSLFYVPKIKIDFQVLLKLRNFNAFVSTSYTGQRSYRVNYYLEPYFLINTGMAYEIKAKKIKMGIRAELNNILKTSYELYRSFPMPLRNFNINYFINI
ncbi:MAG: hypothetical protein IPO21_21340 [Bacteroidales bacterium]|nr:hypothetical protein [Bacteroidales bacterium]